MQIRLITPQANLHLSTGDWFSMTFQQGSHDNTPEFNATPEISSQRFLASASLEWFPWYFVVQGPFALRDLHSTESADQFMVHWYIRDSAGSSGVEANAPDKLANEQKSKTSITTH